MAGLTAIRTPYNDSIWDMYDQSGAYLGQYDSRGKSYYDIDPYVRQAMAEYEQKIGFFNPETGGPWWDLDYFGEPITGHGGGLAPWRQPAYQDPEYFKENAGQLKPDEIKRVIMALESGSLESQDPQNWINDYLTTQQQQERQPVDPRQTFWSRIAAKREAAGKPAPFSAF